MFAFSQSFLGRFPFADPEESSLGFLERFEGTTDMSGGLGGVFFCERSRHERRAGHRVQPAKEQLLNKFSSNFRCKTLYKSRRSVCIYIEKNVDKIEQSSKSPVGFCLFNLFYEKKPRIASFYFKRYRTKILNPVPNSGPSVFPFSIS